MAMTSIWICKQSQTYGVFPTLGKVGAEIIVSVLGLLTSQIEEYMLMAYKEDSKSVRLH